MAAQPEIPPQGARETQDLSASERAWPVRTRQAHVVQVAVQAPQPRRLLGAMPLGPDRLGKRDVVGARRDPPLLAAAAGWGKAVVNAGDLPDEIVAVSSRRTLDPVPRRCSTT